jgi:hypothetical protein
MNNLTYAHRLRVLKAQRTALVRAICKLERQELRLNRPLGAEAVSAQSGATFPPKAGNRSGAAKRQYSGNFERRGRPALAVETRNDGLGDRGCRELPPVLPSHLETSPAGSRMAGVASAPVSTNALRLVEFCTGPTEGFNVWTKSTTLVDSEDSPLPS